MNIGVIGCGLIGKKRAQAIDPEDRIVAACDTNMAALENYARQFSCEAVTDWEDVVQSPNVDAVIVSVFHQSLAETTLAAVMSRKNVLVEKPAARNASELKPIRAALESMSPGSRPIVKCGFNHRFHPAFVKAREILADDTCGPFMFIRGRYGHGGRPGYDREWRADPVVSGGGELLDQGIHLIDLARSFLGDFSGVQGIAKTFFWNMKVDDNAFLLLETPDGQVAQLHVSWTEWKNLFSFEIYTKFAKLHIEGLGGSYGTERLSVYSMTPEMGPPDTVIYEFPGQDLSWKAEWANFKGSIEGTTRLVGSIEDAFRALEIVDKVYELNR